MVNKVLVDVERQGERKIWLETRCEDGEREIQLQDIEIVSVRTWEDREMFNREQVEIER